MVKGFENLMSVGFVSSFQLVNMLGESENRKCNVFFSRLDLLKVSLLFHVVFRCGSYNLV